MKDRRYIYQLQLVKVPVKWTARIRTGLQPVTRRMSDERIRNRRARLAAHKFMAALFADVPSLFRPPELPVLPEMKQTAGKLIVFNRYRPLTEGRDEDGPDAGHEGSGRDLEP